MRALAAGLALAALIAAGSAFARTIEGTPRNDQLVGTPRADAIFGQRGADRLSSGAGADFLHGGPGRDLLDGGTGNDRIAAQYDGGRDAIRCGPGIDVVNADLLDTVSPDCELVGLRLSRDPYTDSASQHETEVEPDSFTVGRTTVATYQVGRRFDGGADNIGFSVSSDDGRSWRSGLLPELTATSVPAGPNVRASDPVVGYDAVHSVWLIATLAIQDQITRLTVSRSQDGFAWSAPVVAIESASSGGITFDKEWIACDNAPASSFRGRCYLVYTDTVRNDRLAVLTSNDGGVTWSQPIGIPVTDAVGAYPVIRPNGDVVVVTLVGSRRIAASVSVDGGAAFTPATTVADIEYRSIRGLRFFPLPSADVDPGGRVWVTWHDCSAGAACVSNDVVVSTSSDGRTWSSPRRITSGRNAFVPAIGIHPTSGRVVIAYYVVRANGGIDAELVESRAGETGFAPPRRLSAQTMEVEWLPDTVSGHMLADYVSVHYAGIRPLAVWVLASEPVGSSLRQAVFATRG
jgi:RTX calcium-binding nonapeptide repeat (4 copies)